MPAGTPFCELEPPSFKQPSPSVTCAMQVSDQHTALGPLECETCQKTFSQKSSLVRHIKLCARVKPVSVRQKSCRQCSTAKARCDLQRPCCSRCVSRSSSCEYPVQFQGNITPEKAQTGTSRVQVHNAPANTSSQSLTRSQKNLLLDELFEINDPSLINVANQLDSYKTTFGRGYGSLSGRTDTLMTAASTTDLPGLTNDWMIPLHPQPSHSKTTPLLAKHSMHILLRLFRTWPRMIVKGFQLPPIFHQSVTSSEKPLPQPLSNCFTLARMWDGQCEGSSAIVQETVLRETKTFFTNLQTYDEANLVAALQALTIYTLILIFLTRDQSAIPSVDPSVFVGLQQVVYYTAGTGMVLQEEADHVVPSWDAWVHVTSKRRVIFTLYMLHWAYSVYHRVPSFNCDELGFMPVPAAKFLWQASTKGQWELLYKRWLAQWDGHEYIQREFLFIKPGIALDQRTQMWLEDADELGVLFLSIWNTKDQEPEFIAKYKTQHGSPRGHSCALG